MARLEDRRERPSAVAGAARALADREQPGGDARAFDVLAFLGVTRERKHDSGPIGLHGGALGGGGLRAARALPARPGEAAVGKAEQPCRQWRRSSARVA